MLLLDMLAELIFGVVYFTVAAAHEKKFVFLNVTLKTVQSRLDGHVRVLVRWYLFFLFRRYPRDVGPPVQKFEHFFFFLPLLVTGSALEGRLLSTAVAVSVIDVDSVLIGAFFFQLFVFELFVDFKLERLPETFATETRELT